jgi:peptidoglycan/xylan/chitin deacetylase (PgdA/CDA1 family)
MPARKLIKHLASWRGRLQGVPADGSVSVLTYHRVTGDIPVELDLPFDLFERQMHWLTQNVPVIDYREAVEGLLAGDTSRPWSVVLTFDDAYEDFFSRALPLLRELSLPATLFVPTQFIDTPSRLPLSQKHPGAAERMRPMTWDQLRELVDEPLVRLGGHTHSHRNLDQLGADDIRVEMKRSEERFRSELSLVPPDFAYPRGAWNQQVATHIRPYCETAAIVGGAVATPDNTQRYAIPRVPIRRSDGMKWFEQRVRGQMVLEEQITNTARALLRRGSGY